MLARRSMSSRIWTVLLAAGPWILSLNWWDWIPTHLFDREAAGKTWSVLTLYCDRGIPMIRRDRRTTYLTILAGFAQKSPKRRGCGRSSAEAGKEQGKGTGRIRIEDELDLRIKSEGRPMCSAPEGGGEGGFTKGKVKSGREGERIEEEEEGKRRGKKAWVGLGFADFKPPRCAFFSLSSLRPRHGCMYSGLSLTTFDSFLRLFHQLNPRPVCF